uniref:Uncharacterized protein n=1 Tax=Coccidioides posadasii RMSCC 3488 TaxID=454284 RepID=A0A0J6F9X4_COCPO|nr:hypothetical protein CPAG_02097 [Coccidioides posadasii RMSCC 3488]
MPYHHLAKQPWPPPGRFRPPPSPVRFMTASAGSACGRPGGLFSASTISWAFIKPI